jgi:regulator of PEP synthase PpsR (kinase-PPPase family)
LIIKGEFSLKQHTIYVCSDAVGETADAVVRATIRQFNMEQVSVKRYGFIHSEDEIKSILTEAAEVGGFVAYTLVQPELREMMKEEAVRLRVRVVDVMGPMMQAFVDTFNDSPSHKPGLHYEMDDAYFKRIEAVEFAVKHDDGKDMRGLMKAQVLLLGVSRTSKTPLSIYLAHKGIKAANLPLTPEVKLPDELYNSTDQLRVGLTMKPEQLTKVRKERLESLGLSNEAMYASLERVVQEIAYSNTVWDQLNCPVIDVTDKSIEETAGLIMNYLNKNSV